MNINGNNTYASSSIEDSSEFEAKTKIDYSYFYTVLNIVLIVFTGIFILFSGIVFLTFPFYTLYIAITTREKMLKAELGL